MFWMLAIEKESQLDSRQKIQHNFEILKFGLNNLFIQEAGVLVEEDSNENIFELQHHHLLRCLEKTTVKMIISDFGSDVNSKTKTKSDFG